MDVDTPRPGSDEARTALDADTSRPGSDDARAALESIGVARHRLAGIEPPTWLHWSMGVCMVVAGLAYLLVGWERTVVHVLVLVAIFVLSFAVQRHTGVVTCLRRPPRRPRRVWIAFIAIVLVAVHFTDAASRAGHGSLGFFALGAFTVICGPRLQALWRRAA